MQRMNCPDSNSENSLWRDLNNFLKTVTLSFVVTHLMWGRVRWHRARGSDRWFSWGEAETLSCVHRRGVGTGSGAGLQALGAGPAPLGLLGEHRLAGHLGRGWWVVWRVQRLRTEMKRWSVNNSTFVLALFRPGINVRSERSDYKWKAGECFHIWN